MIGRRQARIQFLDRRSERSYRGFGQTARNDFRLYRQSRDAVSAPEQWIFLLEIEGRELAERNRASVWQRNLQGAQRRERHALLIGRPCDDVDKVDPIPDLRDGST